MAENTSIVANQSFAERMFERIRENLGDLMTEVELKALLERAVDEAFFAERVVQSSYLSSERKSSRFVELTRELMEAEVKKQVDAYFMEHADEIKEKVGEVLQQGIGQAVLSAVSYQLRAPLMQFQSALSSKGLL